MENSAKLTAPFSIAKQKIKDTVATILCQENIQDFLKGDSNSMQTGFFERDFNSSMESPKAGVYRGTALAH